MVVVKRGKWDSSDDEKDSVDDKKAIKTTKIRKTDTVDIPSRAPDKEEPVSETAPATDSNAAKSTASVSDSKLLKSIASPKNVVSEDLLVHVSLPDDCSLKKGEQISTDTNSPKKCNVPMDVEESQTVSDEPVVTIVAPVAAAKVAEKIEHNPLHHGCRSVDEYIRLNFIDQGTYGVVFRARCKRTGKIYALKQVKIGKEAAKVGFPVTALRETNILPALKHPNIVR